MSITDELREFIETHLYLGATALGGWKEGALAIADRIDERIEREYVKLPVDADGVPIHVGDELDGLHYEDGTVTGIQYGTDGRTMIAVRPNGWDTSTWRDPGEYCHRIADSWERIIEDAVKNGMYDHDNERIQQKLVERCRRLAGAE